MIIQFTVFTYITYWPRELIINIVTFVVINFIFNMFIIFIIIIIIHLIVYIVLRIFNHFNIMHTYRHTHVYGVLKKDGIKFQRGLRTPKNYICRYPLEKNFVRVFITLNKFANSGVVSRFRFASVVYSYNFSFFLFYGIHHKYLICHGDACITI